jgi:hypothetical protein
MLLQVATQFVFGVLCRAPAQTLREPATSAGLLSAMSEAVNAA